MLTPGNTKMLSVIFLPKLSFLGGDRENVYFLSSIEKKTRHELIPPISLWKFLSRWQVCVCVCVCLNTCYVCVGICFTYCVYRGVFARVRLGLEFQCWETVTRARGPISAWEGVHLSPSPSFCLRPHTWYSSHLLPSWSPLGPTEGGTGPETGMTCLSSSYLLALALQGSGFLTPVVCYFCCLHFPPCELWLWLISIYVCVCTFETFYGWHELCV